VCLADQIAPFVDDAYATDPGRLFGPDVLTLGFLFGFQIYFDFAGYSHIALGVARLMGVRFPENFHFPYHADSPRTFWRRWHISLSSWIRDYVYLPLAGVKVADRMSTGGIGIDGTGQAGRRNAMFALFATWAIMGLWHGAAWTFVLWGLWHATLVAGHRLIAPLTAPLRGRVLTLAGWAVTLGLVMVGWIPFRSPSLEHTFAVWGRFFDLHHWLGLGLRESTYIVAAMAMAVTLAAPFAARWLAGLRLRSPAASLAVLVPGAAVMMALIVIYLRPISQFIYFQF
jgi:D-alanyl-lipoteichoic acid acyltransferase DltB (MBOAT superfamily)